MWREPSVLTWGAAGPFTPKPLAPTSTYGSKPASEPVDAQLPGSFLLLEAGMKGGFAQTLSRDVYIGLFSVRERVVPSHAGDLMLPGSNMNVIPVCQT